MKKIARLFMPVLAVFPVSWDNLFNNVIDYMYPAFDQYELSENVTENLYKDLYNIYLNPININSTCTEQLLTLPFLSSENIEELEAYVYFNKGMLSLGEIQLINSFDNTLSNILQYFLYVGPYQSDDTDLKIRNVKPHNEILADYNQPLYRKADINLSSSLRYSYTNFDNIIFGITMQSDFGEHLYDYISPYFVYNGKGILQNIVVGNMRVSFGQGLIANQGFNIYNSVSNQIRQSASNSIKPHSGVSEYGYLTGVGAALKFGFFKISAVTSYTAVDANVNKDGYISSFKQDGYHRTNLEKSKHHNTSQLNIMFHVEHFKEGINIGTTCSYTEYDRPLLGKVFKSNVYALDAGLLDYGVDFLVNRSKYSIAAECAASCITCNELFSDLKFSALFSGGLNVGNNSSLRLMARYYSSGYFSPFSGGFSKGSCNNEYGLFLSYSLKRKYFTMNLNHDSYMLKKIFCYESGAQFDLTHNNSSFSLKLKSKYSQQHTCRLRFDWKYSLNSFSFQTLLNYCLCFDSHGENLESGYALQERISYAADSFVSDFSCAVFFTDSYNTRISMYEKGLLYSYGFSNFYGRGMRMAVSGNIKLDRLLQNLTLRLKVASTIYFDRKEITSQTYFDIDTFHKEDMSVQLQYQF